MHWLVYGFGVYLMICYVWAIYLVVRLYTGKRLRNLIFDTQRPTSPEPSALLGDTGPLPADESVTPAADPDRRKAAA